MAIWERYDGGVTLGVAGIGSVINTTIFLNQEDTDNFQNADVVGVDGILTLHTDTDALCGVRLLVVPEEVPNATLAPGVPRPDDRMVWYQFYAARGPLIYRLRSKKTIPPNHRLVIQTWKAQIDLSTVLVYGLQVLWVLKH